MTGHDDLGQMLRAALPAHLARLRWDRARLEVHQRDALRALLRRAASDSPFHARRLAAVGVEPETFVLDELARLPIMTKSEMMDQLDDVFTDRRLRRELIEGHLAATGAEPRLLFDEFLVLASGGSSGQRGLFVFDRAATVDYILGVIRPALARMAAVGSPPPPGGVTIASVAASSAIHATRAVSALMSGGTMNVTSIPVTLPVTEIVERLNALQPWALQGYPSMLAVLAEEKRAGRLAITPLAVTASSELCPAQTRARIEAGFGVPIVDQFASTEGVVGASAPGEQPIVLASDLTLVELVDEQDRPVPPGTRAAKALVTNLFNRTQPLIRYELTDRLVEVPAGPEQGHLVVRVEGRQDDLLRYGNTVIHPNVVRSALLGQAEIIEYQVRQTARGLDVAAVCARPLDAAGAATHLEHVLADAGLSSPEVRIAQVDAIERDPRTGKARRFVTTAGA
jgi:phenylacetate-coenzyme A ligase PaaK-like adenylate-forming protein